MTSSRVVVVISAGAEWRAIRGSLRRVASGETPWGEWIQADLGSARAVLLHGGWGKIAAAGSTQHAVDRWNPELLVNLGTCGGFQGAVGIGEILLARRTVVYDILDRMSDPEAAILRYATELDLGWLQEPYPLPARPTVMVSADRDLRPEDIPELRRRYGAVAADWESGAIAHVSERSGVACLILRGVSDLVGPGGGEADGLYALFEERAEEIMIRLIASLPEWIAAWTTRR